MAEKKRDHFWMEKAFANAHGQLRKKTRTKSGHNISKRALEREAHSKNPRTKKQAVLARTARKYAGKRHHSRSRSRS